MRLFTAIELPEPVRAAVAGAAAPMLRPLPGVRAVAPENLHVTLCFLGEVGEDRLPAIRAAIAEATAAVPAARVQVAGFGAFPNVRSPRTVWAGVTDPSGVIAAAELAVSARIGPLGFPRERRPFTAHVTVARIDTSAPAWRRRGPAGGQRAALVLPPPLPLGPEFPVCEVVLFRSDLASRGPRYVPLDRFPLAASA